MMKYTTIILPSIYILLSMSTMNKRATVMIDEMIIGDCSTNNNNNNNDNNDNDNTQ